MSGKTNYKVLSMYEQSDFYGIIKDHWGEFPEGASIVVIFQNVVISFKVSSGNGWGAVAFFGYNTNSIQFKRFRDGVWD